MKLLTLALMGACLLFSAKGFSQQPDTLIHKLDSLNKKTDTAGGQKNVISPRAYNEHTQITFSTYFILLGSDLKQQFTAPFHQTGKEWLRIGAYAAGIAGISAAADEPVQRFAIKLHDSSNTVSSVSSYVTRFGGMYEVYTLAALGTYGIVFKNKKMQTTTLLATQAYLTAGAVETAVKFLTGRQRPAYYVASKPEPEPAFHGPFFKAGVDAHGNKINSSFPSGHTTVAFAAATVFAMEYKNTRWVPFVSYGAASLIGLSRITENKHWTTDVLVGATLGYLSGRQVVNNYHRYAKVRSQDKRKGSVSFNFQYLNNQFVPGAVYTFR
jgi:membrane-associated phospholipid phosphatase